MGSTSFCDRRKFDAFLSVSATGRQHDKNNSEVNADNASFPGRYIDVDMLLLHMY